MSWRLMREHTANLFQHAANGAPCIRGLAVVVGFSICFALTGCHSARRPPIRAGAAQPVLSASPNPIPAGDINELLGTTTITWDTGNGEIGDLYVKVDREPEKFMARAPSGTHEVRWIQFDSFYEFRLYSKKHSKLLAKLEVTRDD
jgi:hypothetical protein